MSEDEINKAVENASAFLRMEGFFIDDESKELCKQSLRG